MGHDLELDAAQLSARPLILLIGEGIDDDPDHWLTRWASQCSDCRQVDLGSWDHPYRNAWATRLNLAIYRTNRPIVLVARGIGCLAVAAWAELEQPSFGNPVAGALLVAPPDIGQQDGDPRLLAFGASRAPLPFPAILVGSDNDQACGPHVARVLAGDWQCRYESAVDVGRLDAHSRLGDWAFGKGLLRQLVDGHQRRHPRPIILRRPAHARFGASPFAGIAPLRPSVAG